jgi:hypothetical protein
VEKFTGRETYALHAVLGSRHHREKIPICRRRMALRSLIEGVGGLFRDIFRLAGNQW